MISERINKLYKRVILEEKRELSQVIKLMLLKKIFGIKNLNLFQFALIFKLVKEFLKRYGIK